MAALIARPAARFYGCAELVVKHEFTVSVSHRRLVATRLPREKGGGRMIFYGASL
jgi:hypothetical protein